MNLRLQLLEHAKELEGASRELVTLIFSFDNAKFDWDNVTENQQEILLELKPLRFYKELPNVISHSPLPQSYDAHTPENMVLICQSCHAKHHKLGKIPEKESNDTR